MHLVCCLTFFLYSCYLYFLVSKSNKKLGTREKSSQVPFVHAAYCEPSVGRLLVTTGYRLFSGCCGTWLVRLYKKIYTRTNLQTASHNGLKTSGPPLDFSTVPFRRWRGITFAMEYFANLITYNGNVKGKPALSKSQQPAVQASEIGQNLFERCMCTLLLLREKRVVLSQMFERKAVCGTIAGEQCLRRREL